jgi:hypothetical protein
MWLYQQLQSLRIARDGPVLPPACSPSCSPPGHLPPFRRPTAWFGQARWLAGVAAAQAAWLDLAAGLTVCSLLALGSQSIFAIALTSLPISESAGAA